MIAEMYPFQKHPNNEEQKVACLADWLNVRLLSCTVSHSGSSSNPGAGAISQSVHRSGVDKLAQY